MRKIKVSNPMMQLPPILQDLLKPVPLTISKDGYWTNAEDTILSYDGFRNPPVFIKDVIKQIDIKRHVVTDRTLLKVQTSDGPVFVYGLTNKDGKHAAYRAELIDSALQCNNPDMYFVGDNTSLLVEHDTGYVLIASVMLRGM